MLPAVLLAAGVLLCLYLFHWKFSVLVSTLFCYYVWKDLNCARPPKLSYQPNSPLCQKVIEACKILQEKYTPPLLWGRFGHVQTLVYGMRGRFGNLRSVESDRHSVVAVDGTTVYYDVFHPNQDTREHIMIVCPGIGSHSGARYIQSLVQHATSHGYRVAVLNHVGALGHTLTGSRIFSYGGIGDLTLMYEKLKEQYPQCKFIGVGISLGANILLRFLAEKPERQNDFVCALSICQGYDPVRALCSTQNGWNGFYNIGVTSGMLDIISRHRHQVLPLDTTSLTNQKDHSSPMKVIKLLSKLKLLLSGSSQVPSDQPSSNDRSFHELITSRDSNGFPLDSSSCEPVDVEGFSKAQMIQEVDEYYTRRVMGFRSVHELYTWSACAPLLDKITSLPLLLVNSRDDPLVKECLLSIANDYTKHNPNAIFLSTEHGGHLGFFEADMFIPRTTSWMDRLIVEYSTTILQC